MSRKKINKPSENVQEESKKDELITEKVTEKVKSPKPKKTSNKTSKAESSSSDSDIKLIDTNSKIKKEPKQNSEEEEKREKSNPEPALILDNLGITNLIYIFILPITLVLILVLGVGAFFFADYTNFKTDTEKDFNNLSLEIANLKGQLSAQDGAQNPQAPQQPTTLNTIPKPNPSSDHWRGDVNNRYVWIEYSDFTCPFCGRIHPDIKKITQELENISWVYRQYPILSEQSKIIAQAAECASDNSDEDFWTLTDAILGNDSNQSLARTEEGLLEIVENAGLNRSKIETCLQSQEKSAIVEEAYQANAGILGQYGFGTPTSVIFDLETGNNLIISGALPYEELKRQTQEFMQK